MLWLLLLRLGKLSHTTPAMATAEKFKKFFGIDFKRKKQKIFFYLTTLSLQRIITEKISTFPDDTPEKEHFLITEA